VVRDSPELALTKLEKEVFQFQTSVGKFQKLTYNVLGTKRDTNEQRHQINEFGHRLKEFARDISRQLKEAVQNDGRKNVKQAKLAQDFQRILLEFQRVESVCLQKMSSSMPRMREEKPKRRGSKTIASMLPFQSQGQESVELLEPDAQMESQLLVDNEIEFHDVLIEEREKGIDEIRGQISEVNEIFQDLAVLVADQGEVVNDIESNIVSTHGHTEQATRELAKASKHQKGARKSLCIGILLMVAVFALVMIILQ